MCTAGRGWRRVRVSRFIATTLAGALRARGPRLRRGRPNAPRRPQRTLHPQTLIGTRAVTREIVHPCAQRVAAGAASACRVSHFITIISNYSCGRASRAQFATIRIIRTYHSLTPRAGPQERTFGKS